MSKTSKYFVVWKGHNPGIYNTWLDCKKEIDGFQGALYKSFPSLENAVDAFRDKPHNHIGKSKNNTPSKVSKENIQWNSIAVDGAWNTKTLDSEYQGVHTKTGKLLFRKGPFADGTNNIMEFLGLVHGLAFLKQHNLDIPIYSDSKTAIAWVKKKKANTKAELTSNNKELFELITRAENWLKTNNYPNEILKWETKDWGEIPADFGRK